MAELLHRVWYVRHAPTDLVRLHPTLDLHLNDGQEWFENLVRDIDANGLDNPLIVHNGTMPLDEYTPCRVVHGCNRYRAIHRLGWKTVPAIVCGKLHKRLAKGAVELYTVEEAQALITDGTFTNHKCGPKVLNANYAQTQIYVRNAEPYRP